VGEKTMQPGLHAQRAGLLCCCGHSRPPCTADHGNHSCHCGWNSSQWLRATRAGPGVTASNNQLYRRIYNGVQDDSLVTGAATASLEDFKPSLAMAERTMQART